MRRFSLATAVALGLCAPASAAAAITELGATATPLAAPVCPKGASAQTCTIVLTRVTALETIRDKVAYPTRVRRAGRIAALTVGLSRLSGNRRTARSYIRYLDRTYGAPAEVAITVLKPVGGRSSRRWAVAAESPLFDVEPYLGEVAQFPLQATLAVRPGEIVALTTPTWAPVLSINLNKNRFAYRQSRSLNCANPPASSQAQLSTGRSARYACDYPGTRVEYSATEITNPVAVKPAP